MTEILSTHTPALFQAAVRRAAELLRAGEAVALPTETVYGLAANACDKNAVDKIFTIKGRPARNPIIVHVASLEMARKCAHRWPALADPLAAAFWPGPLTMVVPTADRIPANVTAGGTTVGLRWPGHPFIQAVIRECGFPLAAPSANLSDTLSPTNADHVRKQLGDRLPLIVDGGQSQVGIESTVVDLTVSPPRLLRPGVIHEQALMSVTGQLAVGFGDSEEILKSPGQLKKHYAPKAKLFVLKWRDDEDLRSQLATLDTQPSTTHIIAHSRIPTSFGSSNVSVIPHDAEAFARAIYAELHRCDDLGAQWTIVEAPPASAEWSGVADRLRRASA